MAAKEKIGFYGSDKKLPNPMKHDADSQQKHLYLYSGCVKDIFENTLATPVVSHHNKRD